MKKQGKGLEVGPMDAVIILKPDGTFKTSLPEFSGETVPEHITTGVSIMYALRNPEMVTMLHKNFAAECAKAVGEVDCLVAEG